MKIYLLIQTPLKLILINSHYSVNNWRAIAWSNKDTDWELIFFLLDNKKYFFTLEYTRHNQIHWFKEDAVP